MASKHKIMGRSVALAILQLMVNIASVAEAQAAPSLAKAGCEEKCGSIIIPYPFGIGNSGCFHDDWFEVVCVNNNIPFLKKAKAEVLAITYPLNASKYIINQFGWYVFINNPIMAFPPSCASGTGKATTATPLDFTGSPFHFSSLANAFGGSGCTNKVSLVDNRAKLVRTPECTSTCLDDANVNGDCCKVYIPPGLQIFNVFFSTTSTTGPDYGCKYAMLGRIDQWLSSNPGTSCSSAMRNTDSIVAVLEWGLKSSSNEAKALLQQSKAKDPTIGVQTIFYPDNTETQCAYCADGFSGSAYVPDGCQDIDECSLNPNPCNNKGTCSNTIGGYRCIPHKSNTTLIATIAGCSIVGVLVLIFFVWGGFYLKDKNQKKKYFIQNGGLTLSEDNTRQVTIFKASELKLATNNFSKNNKLGQGGQGAVYKGNLRNGTLVAIKKCNIMEPPKIKKGVDEESLEAGEHVQGGDFVREVILLSQTKHLNIVKLLGCCLETKAPLLVYECLVNGDLAHKLHGHKRNNEDREMRLSWEMRLKIAAQVADGLTYLHLKTQDGIYHRDVKSDNILLDNVYTAKLADFGISQSVSNNSEEGSSNMDAPGSAGYLDPEYIDTKRYTAKSDVYSFGVVLAELLTGRKPISRPTKTFEETEEGGMVILANYFTELETKEIMESLLDEPVKNVQGKERDQVKAVIEIAKQCLEKEGINRPKMNEVAIKLETMRSPQTRVLHAQQRQDHPQMGSISDSLPRDQEIKQPLRDPRSKLSDAIE